MLIVLVQKDTSAPFLSSIISLVLVCRLTPSPSVPLVLHQSVVNLLLPDEGLSCGFLETLVVWRNLLMFDNYVCRAKSMCGQKLP